MFSTLRGRLIASHIVPLLITVPIMGIAFIYLLGEQLALSNASQQLTRQAALIADLANANPALWQDGEQAQQFLTRLNPELDMQVSLLSADGRVLASSSPSQTIPVTGPPPPDAMADPQAIARVPVYQTLYNPQLRAMEAEVVAPVMGSDQSIIGAVRLTNQLARIFAPFQRMRYLIVAILLAGLMLSAALGWVLALDLQRPLHQVTLAVQGLASGKATAPLPQQPIEEIGALTLAFNVLNARLHAAEENRRLLLANIIHELGRPLGALRSADQALLNGADSDPEFRRELLTGMDEELKLLHRLLSDLTQLDQQPTQPSQLLCRPVALSEWLMTVMAPRRELARAKGVEWCVNIPADLPTLSMDPDRMGQALGNLLHNAIKYTPRGGKITITAGSSHADVWVRVSDTGPGMTPEEQRRAFEPFYRGNSIFRLPQGMGLGLTIARDLVISHGGRLELESTPGAGSVFTLWLPQRSPVCSDSTP